MATSNSITIKKEDIKIEVPDLDLSSLDITFTDVDATIPEYTHGNIDSIPLTDERYVIGGTDTRLTWNGSGIFDIVMKAIDDNLRIQDESGRIVGTDYAQVYAQLVPQVLEKSLQFLTFDKELELKKRQLEVELNIKKKELELKHMELKIAAKKTEVEAMIGLQNEKLVKLNQEKVRAETKVIDRQLTGFDDNLLIKLLQAQLESFSLIFTSGLLDMDENSNAFPEVLKASKFSEMYNRILTAAGKQPLTSHSVEKRIAKAGEESAIEL